MSAGKALTPLVKRLHAWRLNGLAAALLAQAGPLAFLSAQALYVAAPALNLLASGDSVMALARALEDPDERRRLAQDLEEATA